VRLRVYECIDWPVPGYDEIQWDCFYRLAESALVLLNGEPILFEISGQVASIDWIIELIHDQVECKGTKEDGSIHRCARIIKDWIQNGVLVQTFSPN